MTANESEMLNHGKVAHNIPAWGLSIAVNIGTSH
jgi:hypothetical protein